jgi:uncharacterized membrane protein
MDTGPATLDGMAYFGRTFPDDRAGIQWLADHAEPDSIIVEGVSGDYWADGVFSRMSMATGLQAVLGWPGYARQWPGADAQAVRDRESDIARLYVTDDPGELVEILERYGVSYVVIGSIEQSRYGIPADAAILSSACDCLEQVFHQGSVTIYRFSR